MTFSYRTLCYTQVNKKQFTVATLKKIKNIIGNLVYQAIRADLKAANYLISGTRQH